MTSTAEALAGHLLPDMPSGPALSPGIGFRRIGGAHVYSSWIAIEWRADFAIYGLHGDDLLVRYEGGCRHGIEHGTGWRNEPCTWVDYRAFSTVEIYRLSSLLATAALEATRIADGKKA